MVDERQRVFDEFFAQGMSVRKAIREAAKRLKIGEGAMRYYYYKHYQHNATQESLVATAPKKARIEDKTDVELLLLQYLQLETAEDQNNWEKAKILAELVKHRPKTWIAQRIDKSRSYIAGMVRTYNVFPDENLRSNNLTFSHHYFIAQKKDLDPYYWIRVASKEKLKYVDFVKRVNGPKSPGASVKQIIAELREENQQLQDKNRRLQEENDYLKNILKAIGEEISQVA